MLVRSKPIRRHDRKVRSEANAEQILANCPKAMPAFISPMKCKLVDQLPVGDDWSYELKLDGFRALAIGNKGNVTLVSRNKKDLSHRFPELIQSLAQIPVK